MALVNKLFLLEFLHYPLNKTPNYLPNFENLNNLRVLSVFDNSFYGKLPVQIGNLSKLQELSLANNLFEGQIPSELSKLTSLEILLLNNNRFNGTISNEIKNLPNLMALEYGNNPRPVEVTANPVSQTTMTPQ